jgi:hypothetical protein
MKRKWKFRLGTGVVEENTMTLIITTIEKRPTIWMKNGCITLMTLGYKIDKKKSYGDWEKAFSISKEILEEVEENKSQVYLIKIKVNPYYSNEIALSIPEKVGHFSQIIKRLGF